MNYIREGTNLKFSLSTTWMDIGREEVELHSFLTSIVDGGEWLTLRSGRFTPGGEPQYVTNISSFLVWWH